jgi:DNA polymerase (family 10)
MDKNKIIELFEKLIFFLKLDNENIFKIRAYENAVDILKSIDIQLSQLVKNKKLKDYDGIGDAIFNKIEEILETGNLSILEKYYDRYPASLYQFKNISGLGPKKINKLYKNYDVDNLEKLDKLIKSRKINEVKGFGDKTIKKLEEEIEFLYENKYEFLAYDFLSAFKKIKNHILANCDRTINILPLGKLRRLANTINKGKILIKETFKPSVKQILVKWDKIDDLKEEDEKVLFTYENKNFVIFFSKNVEHILNFHTLTGSKNYINYLIEENAYTKHNFLNLNNEREIYTKLNYPYIPPECRETKNAVDFFTQNNVNSKDLISRDNIKGIIHIHTNYSDGHNTLEEIASYLYNLNYEYAVITDHSKSSYYANGLDYDDLLKQWKEIDCINKKYKDFKIFKGIEIDILGNGTLDYKEDILKEFDFIIASIHSNMNMKKEKATNRLLKAMDNRYLNMIGHISGRLLTQRKGYPLNYNKIFEKASKNNIAIEFNCNPYRMDIDWKYLYDLKKYNILTSLNPDAHNKEQIEYMDYGIKFLRKAFLKKSNVMNALSLKEFESMV